MLKVATESVVAVLQEVKVDGRVAGLDDRPESPEKVRGECKLVDAGVHGVKQLLLGAGGSSASVGNPGGALDCGEVGAEEELLGWSLRVPLVQVKVKASVLAKVVRQVKAAKVPATWLREGGKVGAAAASLVCVATSIHGAQQQNTPPSSFTVFKVHNLQLLLRVELENVAAVLARRTQARLGNNNGSSSSSSHTPYLRRSL